MTTTQTARPAFYMTVTSTDGTVSKGTCTEAQAARSLATAARRGYFVEVLPNGGASIKRKVHGTAGGDHWVRLEPMRYAGNLTATVRHDLFLIGVRPAATYEPETGRIKAGYINSIPPGASAYLRYRGLVTMSGTTVTISLSARLAMLAQDSGHAPWSYKPNAGELHAILVASKGAPMTATTQPEIRYVWLAKKNQSAPPDVLGLFSSPERAKRVCQDSANEYMSERSTPALIWQGDDTYCSADYHHPAAGAQVFTIDMYELDKVQP